MTFSEMLFFPIGCLTLLFGVQTVRDPLWIYRLEYRWLKFVGGEMMSAKQRADMDALVNRPDEWARQHSKAVLWTRIWTGGLAVVLGIVVILFGLLMWRTLSS